MYIETYTDHFKIPYAKVLDTVFHEVEKRGFELRTTVTCAPDFFYCVYPPYQDDDTPTQKSRKSRHLEEVLPLHPGESFNTGWAQPNRNTKISFSTSDVTENGLFKNIGFYAWVDNTTEARKEFYDFITTITQRLGTTISRADIKHVGYGSLEWALLDQGKPDVVF